MGSHIGVFEDKMKFKLELTLNKPVIEVWKAFDNPNNMSKLQPSLTKFELLSGTQGQPGAVSKLTYEEGGREFSLTEKITHREEPHRLDGIYENEFTDNPLRNTFIARGESETLWAIETEFKFKTLVMRMLGPLMKKNFMNRTQKDMERFKEFVESL